MKTKYLQAKIDRAIAAVLDGFTPTEDNETRIVVDSATDSVANFISAMVAARGQLDTQRDVAEGD